MSENVNKYGLSRTIDSETKRIVRKRCGFGCVNCGCAIYQYEHLDPPFHEAREHDPEKIVLLCGGCHDRVTRRLLSKDTISHKAKNPICKSKGYSFGPLDTSENKIVVKFGPSEFTNVRQIINVLGDNVLSITKPHDQNEPLLINAYICDAKGNEILRIEDNEWKSSSDNWDVEVVANRIIIRSSLRNISLILRAESPGLFVIERLSMFHKGAKIECREGVDFFIQSPDGLSIRNRGMRAAGCEIGILVTPNAIMFGFGGGSVSIGPGVISF